MTRFAPFVVSALALLPSAANAQEPSSSIQPGMRVRVFTSATAEPVTGKVLSLEGRVLTMVGDQSGTPIGVSRDSITQVDVSRGRRSRGKAVLNGVLVGVGSAFVLGMLSGDDPPNQFLAFSALEKGVLFNILTVPAGALIGLIAGPGPERWTTTTPTSAKVSQTVAPPTPSLRFSFRF